MKRRRKRVWIIVLSVILIVIAGIIIWFKIPYDFVNEPARAAFIDSSMFGIPFQGYDYYTDCIKHKRFLQNRH